MHRHTVTNPGRRVRRAAPSKSRQAAAWAAPLALGVGLCADAGAQAQQVVRPPIANYWMTAATTSGFGASMAGGGGIGALMGMAMGRPQAPARTLELRLGSSQAASGPPQAEHLIPPAMAMGQALPLLTPEPAQPRREPLERSVPQGMEQPKGRLLIYWGCGEKAGPGQPVVIDFSKVAAGQAPPNLTSRSVRAPRGPAFGVDRSFGEWPHGQERREIPADASMVGEHVVKGNYSPEIRFAVTDRHNFMPGVELNKGRTPSGATQLTWKPLPGATGYFISAFGARDGGDIVMWTSSAVQEMGGALSDYVPPAEAARLVREQVVLAPDRGDCTVSVEASQAMPAGMLSFVAYGDELNLVHPPRPQDPKMAWEQQWALKLRLKSTTSALLMEGADFGGSGAASRGAAARGGSTPPADGGAAAPAGTSDASQSGTGQAPAAGGLPGLPGSANEAVEQGVKEGVRVLRGIFGR